ncbi:MAG: S8 family serine peptidase [Bacteroidota bacterium]
MNLQISTLLLALLVLSLSVKGQNSYYWASGKKVYLTEDHSRLKLDYSPNTKSPVANKQLRRSNTPKHQISSLGQGTFMLSFEQAQAGNLHEIMEKNNLSQQHLQGASWALVSERGYTLWLNAKVMFAPNEEFNPTAFEAILESFPQTELKKTASGLSYITTPFVEDVLPLSNALYESGMMVYAHPDFLVEGSLNSPQSTQSQQASMACPADPIDPLYEFQYYIDNDGTANPTVYPYQANNTGNDMNVVPAWCVTKGSTDINVAIIDQGIEAHEEFNNDSIAGLPSRILPGYDAINGVAGSAAPVGNNDIHGMAVAGVIAGSHNEKGIAGIAPKVNILPILISLGAAKNVDGVPTGMADPNYASVLQFADAIQWAWKNGADVINNSWTFSFCDSDPDAIPAISNVIDSALIKGRGGLGAVVVFASGDRREGINTTTCVHYPASIPDVMTVSSITVYGTVPNYGRFGSSVDVTCVSSPDSNLSNISVVDRMGEAGLNNSSVSYEEHSDINYTKWFGGTSTSSAAVSGVAALVLSVNENLTATQVMNIISSNATQIGASPFTNQFGFGLVNALDAVNAASTFPVEYVYLQGQQEEAFITLEWATGLELNNDKFIVEKEKGDIFQPIGEVIGAGNSSVINEYSFVDRNPVAGTQVYRLRQVDFNGTFEYSPRVEVFFEPGFTLSAPSRYVISQGPYEFEVYDQAFQAIEVNWLDLQGRMVKNWNIRPNSDVFKINLSLPSLSSGMYIMQIKQSGRTLATQKVLVSAE